MGGAMPDNPAFTAFGEADRNCVRVYADRTLTKTVTSEARARNVP
jgi:hypothetical protein